MDVPPNLHVLGSVRAKSLVECNADETVGLACEVDNLPLLAVRAPDTDSPSTTSTLVKLVAVTGDTLKGNLGGRLLVAGQLGVAKTAKTLERKETGTEGVAALLDSGVGGVDRGGAVGRELSGLGGVENALAEDGLFRVAGNR
jgi:hypothetical protein